MSTGTHCPSEHPLPALLAAHNASEWTGPTGNNTWLLRGRVPTLIDAGVGHPAHLEALARALDGASLAQVLVTHGHRDHVSGAAAIAGRWPGVRVRRFGDPDGFADGEVLEAGDANVGVVHTPGHAPDHCCFELPAGAGVFCGDMARLGGTVVIPASKGGDLAHYLESLRQLQARAAVRWYPGHGPVIDDPSALVDLYLRHRAARDAQILGSLARGAATAPDIVREVYPALAREITTAAADTVLAHLVKLRAEGAVVQRGEQWMLAE